MKKIYLCSDSIGKYHGNLLNVLGGNRFGKLFPDFHSDFFKAKRTSTSKKMLMYKIIFKKKKIFFSLIIIE